MPRPAPERLRRETYPWSLEMLPRFGDMDALRHLNNVALARIHEDARARFQHAIGTHAAFQPKHGLLVAEVAVQYLAEGRYPDPLTAACGVGRVGASSLVIAQALFQGGRCIGTADATFVYVDRATGRPQPLPEGARAILSAHTLAPAPPHPQQDPPAHA